MSQIHPITGPNLSISNLLQCNHKQQWGLLLQLLLQLLKPSPHHGSPFCRFLSRCLAVQAPFSPTQCEGRNQIQDKNTPCAAAWLKHAVTRSCLFILCQLFLLAPSFLTFFKSASNSSITSIYFLNTLIPLNRVFMVGSSHCKHSAEIRHLLAAAPGILTRYLPLFKLSKSGCFLNTIRTEV